MFLNLELIFNKRAKKGCDLSLSYWGICSMSVDEPDDEIIRKKEFKRSFEINFEGLESRESSKVNENRNEKDDA